MNCFVVILEIKMYFCTKLRDEKVIKFFCFYCAFNNNSEYILLLSVENHVVT